MNVVERLFDVVSYGLDLNKATLSGAIDIVVVKHEDGTFSCTPFHVRFGKLHLLKTKSKAIYVYVNGRPVEVRMKLGSAGEGYFVEECDAPVQEQLATSPIQSPPYLSDLEPVSEYDVTPEFAEDFAAKEEKSADAFNVFDDSDLLQEDEEEAQKKGHERDNDDNEEDDPFARLIRSAKDVDKDDPMLDQTFKSTSVLPSSPVTCSSGRATPHLSDTDAISQLSQSMPELRIMGSDTPITEEEDSDEEWGRTPAGAYSGSVFTKYRERAKRRAADRREELDKKEGECEATHSDGSSAKEEKEKGGWKWKWGWGGLPDVEKPPSDKEEEKEVPGEELVVPKSDPYSPPPSPLNKEPSFWVRIFQFGRRQSTNFVPLAAQRGDDKMVIEARNGRAEVDSTGEVEWKEGSDEPTITEVSSASESLSFVSTNGDGSATEGESTGNTDTSSSFDQGEIEVQQEKEEGQELEHDQKDVEEKEVEGEEKVQDQVLDEEMDRPDSSNSNDTANTLDEVPQDLSDGEDGQGGTEKGPKRDPSEMDEGEQQLLRMSPEELSSADIELSRCAKELFGPDRPFLDPATRRLSTSVTLNDARSVFDQHVISFKDFTENPSVVGNDNLAVRVEDYIYPFSVAGPALLSMMVFKKPLPAETLQELEEKEAQRCTPDGSTGWRSWFSSAFSLSSTKKAAQPPELSTFPPSKDGVTLTEKPSPTDDPSSPKSELSKAMEAANAQPASPPNGDYIPKLTDFLDDTVFLRKSLRPTQKQLESLNLEYGPNKITFAVRSELRGFQTVSAMIYLFKPDTKFVVSDIDGTITRSDVAGQVLPLFGKDWCHAGIAKLYTDIQKAGYQLLYLTSRAIGQSNTTRGLLDGLKQEASILPKGPVLMSPDRLLSAFNREVVIRRPEEFKIACLKDVLRCFSAGVKPFYAGFGNRETDSVAYIAVGVPESRIFVINPTGEMRTTNRTFSKTYSSLNDLVHEIFPSVTGPKTKEEPEFWDVNFWKIR